MGKTVFSFLFLFAVLFSGCGFKKKSGELADSLREMAARAADGLKQTDSTGGMADSGENKKMFLKFFGFSPGADVSGLYYSEDVLGIDHKYAFAFRCDSNTVKKICSGQGLQQADAPDNFSESFWPPFSWWNAEKVRSLRPFLLNKDGRYYQYLWYDGKSKNGWYLEFDM